MKVILNKKIDTEMFFIFTIVATMTSFFIYMVSIFSSLNYEKITLYYVAVNLAMLFLSWIFSDKSNDECE